MSRLTWREVAAVLRERGPSTAVEAAAALDRRVAHVSPVLVWAKDRGLASHEWDAVAKARRYAWVADALPKAPPRERRPPPIHAPAVSPLVVDRSWCGWSLLAYRRSPEELARLVERERDELRREREGR